MMIKWPFQKVVPFLIDQTLETLSVILPEQQSGFVLIVLEIKVINLLIVNNDWSSKLFCTNRFKSIYFRFNEMSQEILIFIRSLAQSAWDIPYLNRKIFLFRHQIFKSDFFVIRFLLNSSVVKSDNEIGKF